MRITLILLFSILCSVQGIRAQNDSLLAVAEYRHTPDTLKAKIYGDLSFASRFADPEKAHRYAQLSLMYARSGAHLPSIAQAYNDLGIVYYDRADYDSALFCYRESLKIRTELDDLKGIGALYNKIGIVYQSRGQFEEALKAQLSSLNCYDSLGFDFGISYAYNNIAILHYNMGNLEKALEYYEQSRDIKIQIGDRDGLGGTLSNMGNIFLQQQRFREALDHYHLALQYIDTVKNSYYTASTFNNLGTVYQSAGKTDSALYYIRLGLSLREKTGDKKGIVSSLSALGNLYVNALHQPIKGLSYLREALSLAREINVLKDHKDVLLNIAEAHKSLGNYRDAYQALVEGKNLSDSIFNETMAKSISELQIKYETEKKEKENLQLLRDQQLKDEEIANKAALLRGLLAILIILTLLTILILVINKSRQNRKLRLLEQQRFREILEAEEKERSRVARELHDGVSQLIVSAKMNVDAIKQDSDHPNLDPAIELLTESLEEVRSVSHNLMPGALIRLGLVAAIRENAKRIAHAGNVSIHTDLDESLRIPEEIARAMYRIYQECLNNMLRYSEATEIHISLSKEEDTQLCLQMEDNGKGFDVRQLDKSSGIGWNNIRFRTSILGGHFEISSSGETGTFVKVNIPLA